MRVSRGAVGAVVFAAPLAGCGGILDPHGPVGAAEKLVLLNSLAIMLVIAVPTIIVTFVFAWWFRASNSRARYRPDWAFSGTLELIVWAIPILVIIFLGGIAWFGSHALDPYAPLPSRQKPVEVQVVSLDWKWLFIYPEDHVAALNELVIPVGRPVHFRLTSSGVMNGMFVPQLGSLIYTMASMTSQVSLQADQAGTYRGLSAQFSGDGFADMHFVVHAVAPEEFSKWMSDAKAAGPTLDEAAYDALAKPSANVPPSTFSHVDPRLFDDVVAGNVGRPRIRGERGGRSSSPAAAEKEP